jgi:hypothetical protein
VVFVEFPILEHAQDREREPVVLDSREEGGIARQVCLQVRDVTLWWRLIDRLVAVDENHIVGSDVDLAVNPQPIAACPTAKSVVPRLVRVASRSVRIEGVLDVDGFARKLYRPSYDGSTMAGPPPYWALPSILPRRRLPLVDEGELPVHKIVTGCGGWHLTHGRVFSACRIRRQRGEPNGQPEKSQLHGRRRTHQFLHIGDSSPEH